MKTILFNPFEKYSERSLLTSGILLTLIGSFLGYWFNARYDGIIDLHFSSTITFYEPLLDNLVNLLSVGLLLLLLGKYLNRKTRFVDILIATMISRLPIYLLSFSNYGNFLSGITEKVLIYTTPENFGQIPPPELLFPILLFSIISILFLAWFISLLYKGFKISSNAKGTKPIILFALTLILAEVISKIIIYNTY